MTSRSVISSCRQCGAGRLLKGGAHLLIEPQASASSAREILTLIVSGPRGRAPAPANQRQAGFTQHPLTHAHDQAGFFSNRNELRGGDAA